MSKESDAQDAARTTAQFGAVWDADQDQPDPRGLHGDDQAAVDALPPTHALLIVQRGPNAGARFLLDAERTTAGRHPATDIFLDDVTVSRKHAEFLTQSGGHLVRDVGSLNGTYVNRERIESAVLRPGDEVQIGKYRLTYHPSPRRREANAETPVSEAGSDQPVDRSSDPATQ